MFIEHDLVAFDFCLGHQLLGLYVSGDLVRVEHLHLTTFLQRSGHFVDDVFLENVKV